MGKIKSLGMFHTLGTWWPTFLAAGLEVAEQVPAGGHLPLMEGSGTFLDLALSASSVIPVQNQLPISERRVSSGS